MAYAYQILDALGVQPAGSCSCGCAAVPPRWERSPIGLDLSLPAVSQHLKILKAAHLVTDRAEGTRRVYAVDQRGINCLRSGLDGFWDQDLIAFKEPAEQEAANGIKTMKRRKRRNHEVRADDVPQYRRQ